MIPKVLVPAEPEPTKIVESETVADDANNGGMIVSVSGPP